MLFPKSDQLFCEIKKAFCFIVPVPVEPVELVVLAISVVVAELRTGKFVSSVEHRNALRKQQSCHQISTLPSPKPIHCGVIGGALRAAIPGVIVIVAVPILFAVRLIVLVVVGNEVVQGEPVMRGDKVDARIGLFARGARRGPGCPSGDRRTRPIVSSSPFQ